MFLKTETTTQDEEVQIGFRFPQKDVDSFDVVAASLRISRSALLRQCVLENIKEFEG
jgi:hypothetical protein